MPEKNQKIFKSFQRLKMSCFQTRLNPNLLNSQALQRGLQQRHSRLEAAALKLVSLDLQGVAGEVSWLFHRGSSKKEFKAQSKHTCDGYSQQTSKIAFSPILKLISVCSTLADKEFI